MREKCSTWNVASRRKSKCLADSSDHVNRRTCAACKASYMRKYRKQGKYIEIERQRYREMKDTLFGRSRRVVYIAIRKGIFPDVTKLECRDCGKQAQVWDHRDYSKPLEVEPVCRACNKKRGPGLNRDVKIGGQNA